MDNFFIKIIFFFLCINNIFSLIEEDSDYIICPEGKYGLECEKDCNCDKWSQSNHCSKIEGRCLDCKFGHYGPNCDSRCFPTCKTNLCCAIKSENFKESTNKLTIKNSILEVEIQNIKLNILADYNVGYPLSIFTKTRNIPLANGSETIFNYNYTNYKVKGKRYENNNVKFLNQNDLNIELPIPIILDNNIDNKNNIDGVIGLGFYNSINEKLFQKKDTIVENIASYKKNEDEVSVIFGDLFEEEKDYVHKLSFCKAEDRDKNFENGLNLECKIGGFGSKSYSEVLQINDTYIQFSLDKDSQLILPNKDAYTDYIKKYYFKEEDRYKTEYDTNTKTLTFCYKTEEINKLNEFGFVINHFFYFFTADDLFTESSTCNKDEGYSTFIIKFSDVNPGVIFGKNFYNETQFTIDNEERKIYFYSKYVEYFSGEIKSMINEDLANVLNPLSWSFIVIGISLFLNIVSFLVYFYFKRKKEIQKLKKID